MKVKVLLGLLLLGNTMNGFAQNMKSEPIFGTIVERKVQKDSTKKKTFNLLKPAFLRVGVMGGALIGFENTNNDNVGGTSGLRVEYGISNKWSVVGEAQGNYFRGTTFSTAQGSLGINWMPFKSRRLQPYFGVGGGIGGNGFGRGRNERNDHEVFDSWFNNRRENNREIQGFAMARTGLNYVLFRKIIATVETGYQLPFNNNNSNGGLSVRIGASYQFGKKKTKII